MLTVEAGDPRASEASRSGCEISGTVYFAGQPNLAHRSSRQAWRPNLLLKLPEACDFMQRNVPTPDYISQYAFPVRASRDYPENLDRTALGVPGRNLIHSAPVFLLVKRAS